jgi:quercetin dioxygenase-like cupin family protein
VRYYAFEADIRKRHSTLAVPHILSFAEIKMRLATTVLIVSAIAHGAATAQTPPAPAAAARTVIAATKLPTVNDKPVRFRAVSVTIAPGARNEITTVDGVLYQMSGSTEVSVGGETKTLGAGEGIFIAAGKSASLAAKGSEPSTSIHFMLAPAAEGAATAPSASAGTRELYRTAGPIPDLKAGTHDLNLTRVTFPAHMPSNAPHHRTGAALYYVLSGTGANTVEGKAEARGPGSFIYEPAGLVHQWGNPGDTPLTFLTFNINQEGVPAVAPDRPATSQ